MSFTEANYESAIVELFREQLGYTHYYGPDVERDYRSPLHEDVLAAGLAQVNPALPAPISTSNQARPR